MVWGTEKVSSLTFAGTQSNNMSDEGAMNNNKEVFSVFVTQPLQTLIEPNIKPHSNPIKPNSNPFEPHSNTIYPLFCLYQKNRLYLMRKIRQWTY